MGGNSAFRAVASEITSASQVELDVEPWRFERQDRDFFNAEEHEAFLKADAKQRQQDLDLDAVEVIPPDQAKNIPKEKILAIAFRYVRTNKNKDVGKNEFIAASRLVISGHLQNTPSQEDGGDRTDASTVPQLGLHLGLSIAASK